MDIISQLKEKSFEIRRNLIKLCAKESIHIGGDLSVTDVMTVLWQYQMNYNPNNLHDENRDRFVLSKGHASAVTTFNQAAVGCFTADDVMKEYATNGGRFSMHSCNLVNPYVEISTGSLGHGLSIASGIAAGLRLKGNFQSRVYVVMGDGEQSEGLVWEAMLNCVHYKLGNLIAIIDNNSLESDGTIDEITSLGDIADKYKTFGWNVIDVQDGNDIIQLKEAFDSIPPINYDVPTVIVCHTIKGKGVSFMENNIKWHAGRLTQEQYEQAMSDLEKYYTKG